MTKAAIIQSNFIPWKGYFDFISYVDHFVFFDTCQYTKRDWRNRNRIKVENGNDWITLPVKVKDRFEQRINETVVSDVNWQNSFFNKINYNYRKAPYYKIVMDNLMENCILKIESQFLSDINQSIIKYISQEFLEIQTEFHQSKDFTLHDERNYRLINIVKALSSSQYISGEAARCYLNEGMFEKEGIELSFMSYDGYKEYPQMYGSFNHFVTILDLLFMTGYNAKEYMLYC